MKRVALTGGIATGKTYIRNLFTSWGIPTVDADSLARDIVKPGSSAWRLVQKRFGSEMFNDDGTIARKRLAKLVFDDSAARRALEDIIHPHVRASIDSWFDSLKESENRKFGIADIPLLFETERAREFDFIILTACSQETQISRLMKRDGLQQNEALKRLSAQLPTSQKIPFADFVIQTERTFEQIDKHALKIFHELTQKTNSG
tara:strand:- start:57 stop:668 length:612 start_codon:yes stop_codon:yes gene_type:complete